jgi:hypothetical protein
MEADTGSGERRKLIVGKGNEPNLGAFQKHVKKSAIFFTHYGDV